MILKDTANYGNENQEWKSLGKISEKKEKRRQEQNIFWKYHTTI